MKKNLLIILSFFILITIVIVYVCIINQKVNVQADKINKEFESYTQSKIKGSQLMTVINKAIDQNEKNEVKKDEKNLYIENEKNSIKIEIKFLESDKTFTMEAINTAGTEAFIKNYKSVDFICTKKEYHKNTKQIKYMLFEEI